MATKRPSALDAIALAAKGNKPSARGRKAAPGKTQQGDTLTTAIHIRREDWDLLRRVAFARAENTGGRASVSAVIGELVESNRSQLTKEAGR